MEFIFYFTAVLFVNKSSLEKKNAVKVKLIH